MTTNLDLLRKFVQTNTPERLADFDGFLLRYKGLHHDDDILLLIEAMGWTACIAEKIPGELKEVVGEAQTVSLELKSSIEAARKTSLAISAGVHEIDQRIPEAIKNIDVSELAKKFNASIADNLAKSSQANDLLAQNIKIANSAGKLMSRSFVIWILLAGFIIGLFTAWQFPQVLSKAVAISHSETDEK
jgi:hypothetical protein